MALHTFMVLANLRYAYDDTTLEFGQQIKITNRTGGASVKGQVLHTSATYDDAAELEGADGYDPTWIVYEAGVADGSPMWVWCVGSVCQVLLEDSTAATRGNWARVSAAVAGRATMTTAAPSPPTADAHFRELGHCMQSVTAGTDALARITFHVL